MNLLLNHLAMPQPDLRTIRLLLVDDNADQLSLLQQAIRRWLPGVRVVSARTGAQALEYLESHLHQPWALPTLILLDLYLPRREDGWRTLDQIQQLPPPFHRIPVVMLSASNNPDDIHSTYKRGCRSYLIKPTNARSLEAYCQTIKSFW